MKKNRLLKNSVLMIIIGKIKINRMKEQDKGIIGIYKITSPSGRVYIGQSLNIENRYNFYRLFHCKTQPLLYKSLKKYGWDNHTSEILEVCCIDDLDIKEIFYKQQFINEWGWKKALFCEIYDRGGGPKNQETRSKMSNAKKGIKLPQEVKNKISKSHQGKSLTQETKNKMSKSRIGGIRTLETRTKMSEIRTKSPYHIKPVIQIKEGREIEFSSQTEASLMTGISIGSISSCCTGRTKSAGGFIWKYKK
jgi:group I intron endonuclease